MSDDNPLEKYGLRALDNIRFARGVVGNTTYAMCAGLLAIGIAAFALRGSPPMAIAVIVIIGLLLAWYLHGTWKFADKHPELALLGGAELLKWREMDMGAKNVTLPSNADNVVAGSLADQSTDPDDAE